MNPFKMIVYPFGLAAAVTCLVMLIGMALFGVETVQWANWQGELVGNIGTIAGLAGAIAGLWMAIRSEHQAIK